ncbi:MAG: 30S ribosomal protein S6--L-glutamate ligase, partial [Planctomycetes bacterium]|nr:30S ribosomal protein S6--L-glutamate ligase [Planctomycetota bacterium]
MHLVVLGQPDGWHSEQLERAASEASHQACRVDWTKLTARVERGRQRVFADDVELTAAHAVIARAMPPGSLEQVVFRMDALASVQAAGVPVINPPKAIECAVDKFLTTARMAEAGLPVPATVACENRAAAFRAFTELGGDVLVKPVFGSEGRGIVRVSDPELAHRTFGTLERLGSVLYVQRFIPNPGFDVRVLVLDGQVLGAIRRRCRGDFRANVAQQAEA